MTTMTRAPAIRVQAITKSYKDLHVLRGVDLDVAAGSIFALLGSNGAGKTTLVRILSTLSKANTGTATVHGIGVSSAPGDVRKSISLTGQFAAVDEVLTGRENLVLVAKVGVSKATVQQVWDARGLKPHLMETFTLSNDKRFEEQLVDVRRVAPQPAGQGRWSCAWTEVADPGPDRTQRRAYLR